MVQTTQQFMYDIQISQANYIHAKRTAWLQ